MNHCMTIYLWRKCISFAYSSLQLGPKRSTTRSKKLLYSLISVFQLACSHINAPLDVRDYRRHVLPVEFWLMSTYLHYWFLTNARYSFACQILAVLMSDATFWGSKINCVNLFDLQIDLCTTDPAVAIINFFFKFHLSLFQSINQSINQSFTENMPIT